MTTPVDIANRALSEIASRETIADLEESSAAAVSCRLWYDKLRRQLLRAAPWRFARTQAVLSQTGSYVDNTGQYPYLYTYQYPGDCLKVNYLLAAPTTDPVGPQVGVGLAGMAWGAPSRANRFQIGSAPTATPGVYDKFIVSNLSAAIAVYTLDVTNPDIFDDLFEGALTAALASKLCMPVTGDLSMRREMIAAAQSAIDTARAVDSNEGLSVYESTPDWISGRGGGGFGVGDSNWGEWYSGNENISWGS
jgi:hypothetical protein